MAVIFGLIVNFGDDELASVAAREVVRRIGDVGVRRVGLPLGNPSVTHVESRGDSYIEFSVYPNGLGFHPAGPRPILDPRSFTSAEISGVGRALYDLLRSFSGYRAAVVGWNPESLVDVPDLDSDWEAGNPPRNAGLVLANDLHERWCLGPEWIVFDADHHWLPYAGDDNIW